MRLKHTLKSWNWTVFGNIFQAKRDIQSRIQNLENELQQNWSESTHEEWDQQRTELCKVEKWEDELLCHQARINWVKDGDRNSKFYHAVIKDRKRRQVVQLAREDDSVTTSATEIGTRAQFYFSDFFSASPYYLNQRLFEGIQPVLSTADNDKFTELPSSEEIRAAIKEMNPASSPGNDGFTGYFYNSCWEIIQDDLCAFILDYFKGAYIPDEISATTLILIPKVPAARQLGDFRPISLGNFSGKIISKILAVRMATLLPKIVDEEQAGFIQGFISHYGSYGARRV